VGINTEGVRLKRKTANLFLNTRKAPAGAFLVLGDFVLKITCGCVSGQICCFSF